MDTIGQIIGISFFVWSVSIILFFMFGIVERACNDWTERQQFALFLWPIFLPLFAMWLLINLPWVMAKIARGIAYLVKEYVGVYREFLGGEK